MEAVCVIVLNKEHAHDTTRLFYADHPTLTSRMREEAEKCFARFCKDHDVTDEEEIESAIEDGYYEFEDGWSVWLTWPISNHIRS